jgi:hypothetical protein
VGQDSILPGQDSILLGTGGSACRAARKPIFHTFSARGSYFSGSGLKLYVPSQCQFIPSVGGETSTRALNPVNCPVPSENVHIPRPLLKSSVQRPTALFPFPASRTTLLSSKPAGIPSAWS